MTPRQHADFPSKSYGHKLTLLTTTSISAALISFAAYADLPNNACTALGNDIVVCKGAVDETINAGSENDSIFVDGVTGKITVNGESGNDSVAIYGSTDVEADDVSGVVADGGDGNDQITVQGTSTVTGDVVGGAGDDSLLVEGLSTLIGDMSGGGDNDAIRVRGESTVEGDIHGGTGNDIIVLTRQSLLEGGATVDGNIYGDDGDELITIQGTSTVTGDIYGGAGVDGILVEEDSTVEGAIRGGDGNDIITVNSGSVEDGISADDGDDEVNLYGGTIAGFDSGNSLDMGVGNDSLNMVYSDTLDISAITILNGGTGTDTLQFSEFDSDATDGGLFGRTFNSWDTVTGYNSVFDVAAGTITNLNVTGGSVLRHTDGTLALRAGDLTNTDTTTLTVDGTSSIDMQDKILLIPLSLDPVNPAAGDDAITVNALDLTGQEEGDSLYVDFNADDTAHQNARDAAKSGNADQIDVSGTIRLDGDIGVALAKAGGYLDSGLPFALSGSVGIIDDLQSDALANPGIAADLTLSETYLTNDLFVDPARIWGLVDQGTGGVYLQWTTPINDVTMAPHAGAGLAAAFGAADVLGTIMSGVTDNSLGAKPVCAADDATACAGSTVSVWAKAGGNELSFGTTDALAGFDSSGRQLSGGVDYKLSPTWSAGLFGALQQTASDLGSVEGYFGPRASSADMASGFVGAYAKGDFQSVYMTAVGVVGRSSTDLTNGTLLYAQSKYNSTDTALGATLGSKRALGASGWSVDPRVELLYAKSESGSYTDSFGLAIDNSASQRRAAATVGFIYNPQSSALSLTVRAGSAYLSSSTETRASDTMTETSASVTSSRWDKAFTASIDASWALSDNTLLTGSVAAETGQNVEAVRGGLSFNYRF